jgi:hypothetical protein
VPYYRVPRENGGQAEGYLSATTDDQQFEPETAVTDATLETNLKLFRERLTQRRFAILTASADNLDSKATAFVQIQNAIDAVDRALASCPGHL